MAGCESRQYKTDHTHSEFQLGAPVAAVVNASGLTDRWSLGPLCLLQCKYQ